MSQDYPLQYFRIAIGDTDNNIVVSGSALAPSHFTGKNHEKWYVNYKSAGVFQIANASNNQVMTANGNNVSLSNNSNSGTQSWKIEGVQKDYDGYFLYYKITSNADSSKSLTYTANKGFSLSGRSGMPPIVAARCRRVHTCGWPPSATPNTVPTTRRAR